MRLRCAGVALLLLHVATLALAADARLANGKTFEGTVVGVTDGDTIAVRFDGLPVTVRLAGIDAPEDAQPFGDEATKALFGMVSGKQVRILSWGPDKYNRTLGVVFTDECVNTKLVREGFAWYYKEYSDSKVLADTEVLARNEKKGLWATPNPTAPWDWRHPDKTPVTTPDDPFAAKSPPGAGTVAATPAGTGRTPGLGLLDTPPPGTGRPVGMGLTDTPQTGTTVYVTNSGTKYHRAGCRHLSKSSIPADLKDAVRRYGPCGTCHPPTLATAGSGNATPLGLTGQGSSPAVARPPAASGGATHWMTTSSGKRHNSGCRYYGNSNGRECGPTDGVACKICGG